MNVLVKQPGRAVERKSIEDTLESLQTQVGGIIEFVHIDSLYEQGIAVIVNEESRLKCLDLNLLMVNESGDLINCLQGNVLFTGTRHVFSEGFSCCSLSEEQLDFLYKGILSSIKHHSLSEGCNLESVILQ